MHNGLNTKKFIINVALFGSNSELKCFFIEQVHDKLATLNLSDKHELIFIKTMLDDKVLKFYALSDPPNECIHS